MGRNRYQRHVSKLETTKLNDRYETTTIETNETKRNKSKNREWLGNRLEKQVRSVMVKTSTFSHAGGKKWH